MDLGEVREYGPEGVWIYPDIGENQLKDEEKRAAFRIIPMTVGEVQRLEQSNLVKPSGKMKDTLAIIDRRAWAKVRRTLIEHVVELRNWFVQGREISKMSELIDEIQRRSKPDLVEMLFDVYEAITNEERLDTLTLGK